MARERRVRRNQGAAAMTESDEVTMIAEEEIANRLPQLMGIFNRIKADVSRMVGYDVEKAHPGINKTIMHVMRQQL